MEKEQLMNVLLSSWSLASSSKWTQENPAKGQCGVTALVVNDITGGEIRKTKLPEGWHFYNEVDGTRYDLTASQFTKPIEYMNIPSNREEAFTDTNEEQYHSLKQRVLSQIGSGK